ncbi:Pentatricopeptide repeat-containing protein [Sesamum alatum]|uniref:Pentatricopeptide repeat-containing protein n=1 Tax=Sesamum alatum TaxID=300844 RepID=A0AAE1XZJ5_9LAMI|nr:Pentatricopeptide repeat-containing protein [Sesamum alatum]
MKLFFIRNYTSLSRTHCTHYHSLASQIIQLCRAGSVSDAILLLGSINSTPHQQNAVSKPIIYATVVHACTKSLHFTVGLQLHCHLIKSGLETDRFVGNSLLALKHGFFPDWFTFGSALTALGNLERLKQGKEVHAHVVTGGFHGNVFVDSSLVDMYAKFGMVEESQRVFDRMERKNSVSWCALLGGYCRKGEFKVVIELFRNMEKDLYSFGTVLRACAGLAAEKLGKEVHCQYLKRGSWRDVVVESALVDLYAKCGCVDFAYRIFLKMPVKNLITWNSMIGGFAQNGRGGEAVRIFDQMIQERVKPDYISFIEVLFACSHSGLVDQGRKHFISMYNDYGLKAGSEHYSCMVDLLGRAGKIEEAEDLIVNSEFRTNPSLWAALLGACATTTNPTVAERIAKRMIELKPDYHLSYVLLANVYRAVGRWKDSHKIWNQMQKRGVKKLPGKSWIDKSSLNPLLCVNSPDTPTEMCEW